jgi:16S rRNA (adenine1518-N6/adenine1519-N6)-dimethyltransferase
MKHIPRKRFGQHFLADPGILSAMAEAIAPKPGDAVVEIGPGQGALTAPLLERLPRLDAVEIDRDLIALLRRRFPALALHEADALAFDFSALKPEGKPLRIVGNLPYNISTPLLFHLMQYAGIVADMHFLLQKEVVDRMAARCGEPAYGRLSVMLQWRFDAIPLFDVPPEAFDPPPKVQSAFVRLVPKPEAELPKGDPALLAEAVKAAFAQRRKMLRTTLKPLFADAAMQAEALAACNIAPTARAEEVPVAGFLALRDWLEAHRHKPWL